MTGTQHHDLQRLCMRSITHFDTPPGLSIMHGVLQLAEANITNLHPLAPRPSDPLYAVYQLVLKMELSEYITRMGPRDVCKASLIVATDDGAPDVPVGFLLYVAATDVASVCAVTYMVVSPGHRRQGIARSMVKQMLSRHPDATLTCEIEKVPYYESMGFKVYGHRDTQITMATWKFADDVRCALLDVNQFGNSEPVALLHANLTQRFGIKVMRDAERKQNRELERGTSKARAFAEAKLAQSAV